MTIPKELKEAILDLPVKEKDKLLLRLLKKDVTLLNRLEYELLADGDLESHRLEVKEKLERRLASHVHDTPGIIMMEMRYASGDITEHVRITKDKIGEISLQLFMLTYALNQGKSIINNASYEKSYKLATYTVARIFKILALTQKQHEDLFLEFQEMLDELRDLIVTIPHLMKASIFHGLDVNWLDLERTPEDIDAIAKDLRQRGYLSTSRR